MLSPSRDLTDLNVLGEAADKEAGGGASDVGGALAGDGEHYLHRRAVQAVADAIRRDLHLRQLSNSAYANSAPSDPPQPEACLEPSGGSDRILRDRRYVYASRHDGAAVRALHLCVTPRRSGGPSVTFMRHPTTERRSERYSYASRHDGAA
eukprot:1189118-Prorocentrum_minimum.AAC.1